MGALLEKIIRLKKEEIAEHQRWRSRVALEENIAHSSLSTFGFRDAIAGQGMSVIAEIKRKSPSHGAFSGCTVGTQARVYQESSAAAISVLTEKDHFEGSLDDLREVKHLVSKPVLRKDFIIDPYQIYESKAFGADAFLLIACILSQDQIREFVALGKGLGLDALVEVHDDEDLKKALVDQVSIIGINNRDLRDDDLPVDLKTSERLLPLVPEGTLVVAESGFRSPQDVHSIEGHERIDALLIGTALLQSGSPTELIDSFSKK